MKGDNLFGEFIEDPRIRCRFTWVNYRNLFFAFW